MSDEVSTTAGLVVLQERVVNLIQQLQMPVVEVSLVVAKHIRQLLTSFESHATEKGFEIPYEVKNPWPIENGSMVSQQQFSLDKVLEIVDRDRMDILETLIRVSLIETGVNLVEGIAFLRSWEQLVRQQLSMIQQPGQLFSPLEIPHDW